jgi:hypothetical protein
MNKGFGRVIAKKGKNGDKTWNVTHTEVIIGSTDRWCGQNQIHLGNVG